MARMGPEAAHMRNTVHELETVGDRRVVLVVLETGVYTFVPWDLGLRLLLVAGGACIHGETCGH